MIYYKPSYENVQVIPILSQKTSIWKGTRHFSIKLLLTVLLGSTVYFGGRNLFVQFGQSGPLKLSTGFWKTSGEFWYGYLSSAATFSTMTMSVGYYIIKVLNPAHTFHKFPARQKPMFRIVQKQETDQKPRPTGPVLDSRSHRKFALKLREEISPNVYRLVFGLPSPSSILGLPTGQHVSLRAHINGEWVSRSYTPISNDKDAGVIELVIKVYPKGLLTNHLTSLNIGDELEFRGPIGAMKYKKGLCTHIGMLAGGTGVTPMYQVIRAVCEDKTDSTSISLIYANNNEEDILLRAQLDDWAKKFPNKFNVTYVLVNPPASGTYETGFVTKDLIMTKLPISKLSCKVMICGPPGMVKVMKEHLRELGLNTPGAISKATDQVFVF